MSEKAILLLFAFILPFTIFSQQAGVSGVVVEAETAQPITGASVSLVTLGSHAYLKGQQTNEDGSFVLQGVQAGTYALKIEYVGYDPILMDSLVVSTMKDLGRIALHEESRVISEVVVKGSTPALRIDIDKKVFDASQSLVSAGGTAEDLLANVPTLQVDQDGAISLRGSSSVRVLIDGKESAMAGSDIASLLQSLPADAIDKVEIITNPSAKYDAEGQSGIVNIVLKKNARLGFNGSVTGNYGAYNNAMAGVTLNYRGGKFNYFGSYNFNRRNMLGDGTTDNYRLVDGAITENSQRTFNTSESRRRGFNHTVRLGSDFYASEKATLSLMSNISFRDNNRQQDLEFMYYNVPDVGDHSLRYSRQRENDFGLDLQMDYKQVLRKEGEELTANVSFGHDYEDGTNDFSQLYDIDIPDFLRNNSTTEQGRIWNFQLDYVLPFADNNGKFEAGYRSMIRNSFDTQFSSVFNNVSSQFEPDYTVSNDFDLQSSVHALYANYQRQITEKIGAQLGLRAEQAYLNSIYYDVDPSTPVGDRETKGHQDYFRLYPSLFLTYALNDQDKLQLNYSRRVQRPNGWQVNPFIDMSNETNFRQGNPNLMPQDIHSFEVGYAKNYSSWNFVSSLFYRRTNDMTMPYMYDADELPEEIREVVGDRSNVTFSRWDNIGSVDAAGIELVSKVTVLPWWDATLNLNGFYNTTTPYASFNQSSPVSTLTGNGNITNNLNLGNNLTVQVRGDYRTPMRTLQGRMLAMGSMDIAVKKDLLNRKASLMLNVRDVFNTRRFRMENNFGSSQMNMSHRFMRRMIGLTFTYRFGFQGLSSDRKEDGGPGSFGGEMGGEF